MKKTAKITYITLRILMAIVLAVSIVGFFLNHDPSVKSSYLFNAGQSALFLLVSFTPLFLKKLDLDIPDFVYIIFISFILAHFLCGEILGFFATVKWWDSALHTISGMLITLISFSIINLLNNANGKDFKLSLVFSMLFAFCISVAVGAIWEIVEFTMDNLFNLNMLRTYESTVSGARGLPLEGIEAVKDTMKDLALDALGAIIVCVVCCIFVIKKGLTIESLVMIRKRSKNEVELAESEEPAIVVAEDDNCVAVGQNEPKNNGETQN